MKNKLPNPIDSILNEYFENELNSFLKIKQLALQYLEEAEKMVADPKLKIAIKELADISHSQVINLMHWMKVSNIARKCDYQTSPGKLSALLAENKIRADQKPFQKNIIKSILALETLQIYAIGLIKLISIQLEHDTLLFEAIADESKQNKLQFKDLSEAIIRFPTYKLRLIKH